jgi:hypothetical protein
MTVPVMELRWGRVGYLASVVFPTFEHVHGITEFPIRPAECRNASVSRIGMGDRCGMRRVMKTVASWRSALMSEYPGKANQCRALRFLESVLPILWRLKLSETAGVLAGAAIQNRQNASAPNLRLIVEDHVQQGTVDFNVAVVVNKTQFPKFVHEMAHP